MRERLMALVAAAAAAAGPARADVKEITLGAAVQLTGSLANTGRYYRDGYQFAVDQINAKGGVPVGGTRYRLGLKVLDDQSDVNLGVRQYVRLVTQDEIHLLLGPFASNACLDDSSVAEKYRAPMVEGGGASGEIFSRGYRYVFGTLPPADDYFGSTIRMMAQLDPRPRTVALVSADDSFDASVAKGTRLRLAQAGLQTVVDEQYAEKDQDFSSILSRIKAASPDVILWSGHEAQALNFIRQAKGLGVSPRILYSFTVGVPTADFRKALGKDASYAFGMTPWLPSRTLRDEWFGDAESFAAAYQKRYGYAPDYHAASAVADVETFAKALQKAGSADPEKVRDAIASIDFDCLYGHVAFGATGQISMPQTVVQIQGDQLVPIYTDHLVGKPRYPLPAWSAR